MKEIEFRGISKHTKEWVYGGYFKDGEEHFIVSGNGGNLRTTPVFSETLGQYTGLKDENSKKIYKGDIARAYGGEYCHGHYEYDSKCIVKWQSCGFDMVTVKEGYGIGWGFCDNPEHIEVIGNFYENPELLENTP